MAVTFTIAGTDYSAKLLKYGIEAEQAPVYGSKVTTLDGIDHNTIVRWKTVLTASFMPLTDAEVRALYSLLISSSISVRFDLPQYGTVTEDMRVEKVSLAATLKNGATTYYSGVKITFTQN